MTTICYWQLSRSSKLMDSISRHHIPINFLCQIESWQKTLKKICSTEVHYVKATQKIYNLEDRFFTWGPWTKLLETFILGYGTSYKSVILKVSYLRHQNGKSAHFHFAARGFAIRPVLLRFCFCLSELHECSTVPHSDTGEPDSSCAWLLMAEHIHWLLMAAPFSLSRCQSVHICWPPVRPRPLQ